LIRSFAYFISESSSSGGTENSSKSNDSFQILSHLRILRQYLVLMVSVVVVRNHTLETGGSVVLRNETTRSIQPSQDGVLTHSLKTNRHLIRQIALDQIEIGDCGIRSNRSEEGSDFGQDEKVSRGDLVKVAIRNSTLHFSDNSGDEGGGDLGLFGVYCTGGSSGYDLYS
jgi:hypothetical protein